MEIIKLFLKNPKINLNIVDDREATLLFDTCQCGNFITTKILVEDGRIDVNQPLNNNSTPFYVACENGYIDIVKYLANNKVDVTKEMDGGYTLFTLRVVTIGLTVAFPFILLKSLNYYR